MTEYEDELTLDPVFEQVLKYPEFKHIVEHGIRFKCLAKLAFTKDGDEKETSGPPVEMKKVPPLFGHISDLDFVILVCRYRWNSMAKNVQEARIHHLLMTITFDEKGAIKLQGPDVSEFSETIARYGLFTEEIRDLRDTIASVTKESDLIRQKIEDDVDIDEDADDDDDE